MKFPFKLAAIWWLISTTGLHAQEVPKKPQPNPAVVVKAAFEIDQHIAAFYRNKQLPVPQVTDDATFMRRAFLVAIGRVPTAEEGLTFIEIEDPTKREALADYLLKSPGFSSHMTNWAFDLLRMTDQRSGSSVTNEPYRNWVRKAITDNMPWDEFTQNLVSSSGDGWDPKTAAVGYYTRDRGMPLDNLSNTMRLFLGERMECAQCHDDPFGKTERHDFFELAAFTHGQKTLNQDYMQPLWDELQDDENLDRSQYRAAQVLWDGVYDLSLAGGAAGNIQLPQDYQYRDGKPGEVVGARTPFGRTVRISENASDQHGRKQLADWIASMTGEQFPSVIANRMWKRVMGKGIYEPVDEFIPAEKTNHPELVKYLTKLVVELDYDLQAFQKVLLLTRTFQFATNPNPSSVEGGDDFHGRKIERLSAEQIWDSLITLAVGDPDQFAPRGLDDRIFLDGKPILVGKKTMRQLSQEVLALKSDREVRNYFSKFYQEIQDGSSGEGAGQGGSMMMSGGNGGRGYHQGSKVRASEMPSPAPRGHFLHFFGASDREVLESASREPNVGQVLSLMNGFVQHELVNQSSAHIYQSLDGARTEREKIRRLYIAILNRPPADEEMSWMLEEVKIQGEAGYRNIVSSLVMSSEFLFLQ